MTGVFRGSDGVGLNNTLSSCCALQCTGAPGALKPYRCFCRCLCAVKGTVSELDRRLLRLRNRLGLTAAECSKLLSKSPHTLLTGVSARAACGGWARDRRAAGDGMHDSRLHTSPVWEERTMHPPCRPAPGFPACCSPCALGAQAQGAGWVGRPGGVFVSHSRVLWVGRECSRIVGIVALQRSTWRDPQVDLLWAASLCRIWMGASSPSWMAWRPWGSAGRR